MVDGFRAMGLKVVEPEGAFLCVPFDQRDRAYLNGVLQKTLQEQKVAVILGDAFGSCGEGYIRCSYAYSKDVIKRNVWKNCGICGAV